MNIKINIIKENNKHKVQKGESLWKISKDNNVRLKDLINANPQIDDPDMIYPGDEINLPEPVKTGDKSGPGRGGKPTTKSSDESGAKAAGGHDESIKDDIKELVGHVAASAALSSIQIPGERPKGTVIGFGARHYAAEKNEKRLLKKLNLLWDTMPKYLKNEYIRKYYISKTLSSPMGGKYNTQSAIEVWINHGDVNSMPFEYVTGKTYWTTKGDFMYVIEAMYAVAGQYRHSDGSEISSKWWHPKNKSDPGKILVAPRSPMQGLDKK